MVLQNKFFFFWLETTHKKWVKMYKKEELSLKDKLQNQYRAKKAKYNNQNN